MFFVLVFFFLLLFSVVFEVMTGESDRALKLASRKRQVKRVLVEELICEVENGLSLSKSCDDGDSESVFAGLVESKNALLEEKKELETLEDEYLLLVCDEEVGDLSREAAHLFRKIRGLVAEVNVACGSFGQKVSTEVKKAQPPKVELPKLKIEKFGGNPSQWRGFWDSFQASVGKNEGFENVQKFIYLKSLLEGKAATAISGLELSNENYAEAVALLSDRFGSRQVVITHHMESLLQLVPVKTGTEVKQLRAVYDKIEVNVRGLQSLGIKPDQYGCLLVPVIMSKVPDDIRLIILRQFSSENWTFEVLLKCFKQELEAREQCLAVSKSSSSRRERKEVDFTENHSSRVLMRTGKRDVSGCLFCEGDHAPEKCVKLNVEKRWEKVKKLHLCFVCLRAGHGSKDCRVKSRCKACDRNHHVSLCRGEQSKALFANARASTLLQTAMVTAMDESEGKHVTVRLIFDLGSNDSYVTKDLKDKLGLKVLGKHKLEISGFGGTRRSSSFEMTSLKLRSRFGGGSMPLSAFVVPTIASVPFSRRGLARYEHLVGLELADSGSSHEDDLSVLIGADQYHRFVNGETKRGNCGPVATNSEFGWILSGPVDGVSTSFSNSLLLTSLLPQQSVEEKLHKFWDLEALGIDSGVDEKEFFVEKFKSSVGHNGERYEVSLPRKELHEPLPDNLFIAKKRLISLKKRLKEHPDVLEQYNKYFQEQLESGIIERVSVNDRGKAGWTHYIPHHGVVRDDKETTKLRVVFDASCKVGKNPSLNDCLEAGPFIGPELFDILVRFRLYPVGLIADIEKAFLMISVVPEDRDVMRFLWFDSVDSDELVVYRQTRVTFGVNASPFMLAGTIVKHLEKFQGKEADLVGAVKRSLYVDDLCAGEFRDDEAGSLYMKSKEMLADGKFNLRKWKTNCRNLSLRFEEIASDEKTKVLGIPWDCSSDRLEFDLSSYADGIDSLKVTKRKILSVIAQLFDPLGILSPIFITVKILLQNVHKEKKGWDDEVSCEVSKGWNCWLKLLKDIEKVEVERFYFDGVSGFSRGSSVEVHGFCDASNSAYGAVVYLVDVASRKSIVVASKSRVAPLKDTSIPRLELLGALVLSVLVCRVREAIEEVVHVDKLVCWTDSMVVLYWLKNGKDLKQFVRNRVVSIREKVASENWRHCPGKENPADLLSRGVMNKVDFPGGIWFKGPEWLRKNESFWPNKKVELKGEFLDSLSIETKVSKVLVAKKLEPVVEFERFSKFSRLVRCVGWVRRFCLNCRNRLKVKGRLTVSEIKEAEIVVLKLCQRLMTVDEKSELETSLRFEINSVGLMEVAGRLQEASEGVRSQVFVPRSSHVAKLIVLEAHDRVKHLGLNATLSELRTRFWVTRGRQFVKSVLKGCVVCSRLNSKSFRTAEEGLLPKFRVEEDVSAFENVGLDYLGPLYVENGKSEEKVWVALFTCATSRAVHLECVKSMKVEQFLNAFKRFCGRRGVPSLIISDNAKTFTAASKYLVKLSESQVIGDYFSKLAIEWTFILEKSPWWGGFWERMVKLTKDALKKTLGKAKVSFEELQTVLVAVEAVINSRPLTYVGSEDETEPLTPSHLVCGKRVLTIPSGAKVAVVDLRQRFGHLRNLMENSKKRWLKEYLTELRVFHKKKGKYKVPKVDDLVVIKDDNIKRQNWKVGRILRIIEGRNGIVRGAWVRTGGSELRRPLELLYPLEAHGWGSFNLSGAEQGSGVDIDGEKTHSVSAREDVRPIIPALYKNLVSSVAVKSSSVPVMYSSVPAAPVKSSSVPVTYSSVPVTYSSVPVKYLSVPVKSSSVPAVPARYSSVPVTYSSVPVTYSSVPVTYSSVPVKYSSVPAVPVKSSSVPTVPAKYSSVRVKYSSSSVAGKFTSVAVPSLVDICSSLSFGTGTCWSSGSSRVATSLTPSIPVMSIMPVIPDTSVYLSTTSAMSIPDTSVCSSTTSALSIPDTSFLSTFVISVPVTLPSVPSLSCSPTFTSGSSRQRYNLRKRK